MSPVQIRQFLTENGLALAATAVIFVALAFQGILLYERSGAVMQQQLSLRLKTAAALGAQRFTGEELDQITGKESLSTQQYEDMVMRLQQIRAATPNILFAYIMRRTEDPNTLEFVVDVDSLDAEETLDENGNGIVDPDEENSYPGDLYDISEITAMQGPAFAGPAVDKEISSDQWGDLISGYAPIYRQDGSVAGIIGIDMDAHEFMALSHEAFSRLALVSTFLMGFIILLSVVYMLWQRRINTQRVIQSERSAMLALATHQLGGPISSIRWWLEVMNDEGLCTKDNACGQITRAVEKMNAIIQQLIDVERQEHNKVRYKREDTVVSEVIQTAVEHIPKHQRESHELVVFVDKTLRAKLDKKLISSALGELMENAMTYSEEGQKVTVSAKKVGRFLYLSVKDHGEGVPPGEEDRIFQKMTRGSNAIRHKPNGNGLGLYVVRLIAQKAGGSIKLACTPKKGCTFTIKLPV